MSASSTMGVLASCLARKQWQNAAQIAGCSIDTIRRQYDVNYAPDGQSAKPERVIRKVEGLTREVWLENTRRRIRRLRVAVSHVSVLAGLRPGTIATYYHLDWGPSQHTCARIDAVLDRLEAGARQ